MSFSWSTYRVVATSKSVRVAKCRYSAWRLMPARLAMSAIRSPLPGPSAVSASVGGLVILQEIFGVTEQLKSVARSHAAAGFDAIVPALFDRVSGSKVIPFDEPEEGIELAMRLDIDEVIIDIDAARDHIDQGNGASVLGFYLGGGVALKAATTLAFKSAVS